MTLTEQQRKAALLKLGKSRAAKDLVKAIASLQSKGITMSIELSDDKTAQ